MSKLLCRKGTSSQSNCVLQKNALREFAEIRKWVRGVSGVDFGDENQEMQFFHPKIDETDCGSRPPDAEGPGYLEHGSATADFYLRVLPIHHTWHD